MFRTELTERNGVIGKECSVCRNWKALNEFHKKKIGLGGRNSKCKDCKSEYSKRRFKNNKERQLENMRQWKKNNREKVKIIKSKRRAKKKSLPYEWTLEEQEKALQFFGGCCLTGGTENIHFDHVIPLSVGHVGTVIENMVPLRGDLNISKKDSNLFEWFEANKERFDLSQERFDRLIEYLSELNGMTLEEYKEFVYWCHENPQEFSQVN